MGQRSDRGGAAARPPVVLPGAVPPAAAGLLPLSLSNPSEALRVAREVLCAAPDPLTASVAHQAIGIVLRDRGQMTPALRELRIAVRLARRSGASERAVDTSATLAASLVMAGRTQEGLRQLDEALDGARGGLAARIRVRRAHILADLGRHPEALDDLAIAVRTLRRNGDHLWEARAINNRSLVRLALGATRRADEDARRAELAFAAIGQDRECAHAIHNRGLIAERQGDLPAALRYFDAAGERYDRLGEMEPDLIIDRGHTLLAAGLAAEATTMIEAFLEEDPDLRPIKRAELLLMAAAAALAAGSPATAQRQARAAQRLFAAQERPSWKARAELLYLQARYAGGGRDGRLLAGAAALAHSLQELGVDDAAQAHLLAGRLALELGRTDVAASHLAQAARHRYRGPARQRATACLAVALAAQDTGRSRQLLAACRSGLDAIDESRLTFGAMELRAVATSHGGELATMALRQTLQRGRPRDVLTWSERWRATALSAPPLRPPDDAELASDLAALRDAARRAEEAGAAGRSSAAADRDRDRWERAVRGRRLRTNGGRQDRPGGSRLDDFNPDTLLAALGDATAVELVAVDGRLHAITASGRRITRHEVGSLEAALREVGFARFTLAAAAHGRPVRDLDGVGRRLQLAVLGAPRPECAGGPVVVVPPARLHGTPWGLMPALAGNPLSVTPSLAMWLTARARPVPRHHRVALVLGPGLSGAEAEVADLRTLHAHAAVLEGAAATAERTLDCLNGTWLTHIATHGTFRSDSPLFSSLALHDGPLTVHDLDRLTQPPYRMLLSACDVGGGEAVGTDEVLSLVTSLLGLGTTGVLASHGPVNDVSAVPVMVRMHRELALGRSLADAWLAARLEALGDAQATATAASFTAWGI